jgi:hypothetical protein
LHLAHFAVLFLPGTVKTSTERYTMSLGKPGRGLTIEILTVEAGKGDSITCFAHKAIFEWQENIPPITALPRTERRELICHLAHCSYLPPLDMMAIILLKMREARHQENSKRFR